MIKEFKLQDIVNDEKVIDCSAEFLKSKIDFNKKVERPPLAVSIGLDDRSYNGVNYPLKFASYGNISMISGEEKSRKTFFKSLFRVAFI